MNTEICWYRHWLVCTTDLRGCCGDVGHVICREAEYLWEILFRVFVELIVDEEMNEVIGNTVLIVIDSIGAALALTAWEYSEGGREIQDELIGMLHYMVAHRGYAIVTTNHFVYWRGEPSPSLGKRWIKAVDFRYLLCKLSDSNYYMQLVNSKYHKVAGEKIFYKISNKGIDSITDELRMMQAQDTEAVITQNWNTVQQIYA